MTLTPWQFVTIQRRAPFATWSRSRSHFTTGGQSVSQSVCLGIEHPCGICDQILLPVGMLLSELCALVSVGRPLWRKDGSEVCIVITQWSQSFITRNHTSLSHLRLSQPGGPGSRNYIPQEQDGPVILPGTEFFWYLHIRSRFIGSCFDLEERGVEVLVGGTKSHPTWQKYSRRCRLLKSFISRTDEVHNLLSIKFWDWVCRKYVSSPLPAA
jgi:hypothetical protein